jgi:hypothetical protein
MAAGPQFGQRERGGGRGQGGFGGSNQGPGFGPPSNQGPGFGPPNTGPGFGPPNAGPGFGGPPQNVRGGDMMNANGFGGRPPSQTGAPLELKLIFNRDEVAYLFGFDGVLVAQLCQQVNGRFFRGPVLLEDFEIIPILTYLHLA